VLAAQRAAARAKAAGRAARLKKQRREARRRAATKLAATKLAAEQREAARDARTRRFLTSPRGGGAGEAVSMAMSFVVAATVAALVILGLALVPAYVVPWYRMSIALDDHREQFAVMGGMVLVGAGLFFALIFLGGH
jgi:hypothetical protein